MSHPNKRHEGWVPANVLVAPDKYKGTLRADEVSSSIVAGFKKVWHRTRYEVFEIADGGDGFCACVTRAGRGRLVTVSTVDAIGRPLRTSMGYLDKGKTAVLDLAGASGLAILPAASRNPSFTMTTGTGRLICRALSKGCLQIVIGLGGSASNEGGIGIAAELGYCFLDKQGAPIALNGSGLLELEYIIPPRRRPQVRVIAATDVDNPLYGENGAAYQFAPQKGANQRSVRQLDRALRNLDRVVQKDLGLKRAHVPGAGAAGGCGFGLMVFLGAVIKPGLDLVADYGDLYGKMAAADLVVTGEGRFDRTSYYGKGPYRIALEASKRRIPVVGVFGSQHRAVVHW